jgi:hypothetical protein
MNQEQFNRLKPYIHLWHEYKYSLCVTLSFDVKQSIGNVYHELTGQPINLQCGACVGNYMTYVFGRYEQFEEEKQNEIKRQVELFASERESKNGKE